MARVERLRGIYQRYV